MGSSSGRRALQRAIAAIALCLCVPCAAAGHDDVFVIGGALAGQPLGPGDWVVEVEAGEPLRGTVLLAADATTPGGQFGYAWTWGDRREAMELIDERLQAGSTRKDVSIELTAPSTPGIYYLLFGHLGNYPLAKVFSVTTSDEFPPLWNDGNDYQDLDDDDLSFARRYGYVEDWLHMGSEDYELGEIAVAPLKIVVRAPSE